MLTNDDIARLIGIDVLDVDGNPVGPVAQVYLNAQHGDPEWVTVSTGPSSETFVPLRGADITPDRIRVAFGKDQISNAARIDADGPMSAAEEEALHRWYGLIADFGAFDEKADGSDLHTGQRVDQPDEGTELRRSVVTDHQQVTHDDPDAETAVTMHTERTVVNVEAVPDDGGH